MKHYLITDRTTGVTVVVLEFQAKDQKAANALFKQWLNVNRLPEFHGWLRLYVNVTPA